jgi:hypothetical protein
MIYTAFNPRMIHLGFVARAIHTTANVAQGLAILAIIGTDTALTMWQDWSDRTFADIQPEILAALESIAYIVGYTAAMAWGYSRLACTNTWKAWLDSAPQRALALDVMGITWDEIRYWFSVAYSVAAVAIVIGALMGAYVLGNAPRWTGKAIAFGLCVSW